MSLRQTIITTLQEKYFLKVSNANLCIALSKYNIDKKPIKECMKEIISNPYSFYQFLVKEKIYVEYLTDEQIVEEFKRLHIKLVKVRKRIGQLLNQDKKILHNERK